MMSNSAKQALFQFIQDTRDLNNYTAWKFSGIPLENLSKSAQQSIIRGMNYDSILENK